jgi:hypothetical protein
MIAHIMQAAEGCTGEQAVDITRVTSFKTGIVSVDFTATFLGWKCFLDSVESLGYAVQSSPHFTPLQDRKMLGATFLYSATIWRPDSSE